MQASTTAMPTAPPARVSVKVRTPLATTDTATTVASASATMASTVYCEDYTASAISQDNPPINEMAKIGLWLELEAGIGFLVGLGLG